mmetsp:Transcript_19492/g.23704  ORF Transcript_19492/g.23704 Transcript_19492/m.23704 type:complete len:319 (+) Transcript_19492:107-1063(+)|eukprot:CAMPEP_0204871144 /NCGR_PEP_ID=MMETSP1348-20121228/34439_1 /ASSEMBLY_ACC=CAM_ASM_000700 /TAXON_ID=215587 /ORGANISM="Aplanochytrium stocchinoi, Strain GSBS06" /LENGTH=318 /DNA_ID=CAMNT_0052025283 /DNA_START=122 /DNA_END=1078 /DNA_ORIENTATION=-
MVKRLKGCRPDRRLEAILINPRLLGLPKARQLSATIFFCIIAINIGFSIFLSRALEEEVCTAESSVYGSGKGCEQIIYTEQIGYRFNNPDLFVGTKAYIAVDIVENGLFHIGDNILSSEQVTELNACNGIFNGTFCLDTVSFATLLPSSQPVTSDIVLPRVPNDQLWEIEINADNKMEVYFSDPFDNKAFIVNALLVMRTNGMEVAKFDVTCIPNIVTPRPVEEYTQGIILSTLFAVGKSSERNDLFGISLSTRFARCCRTRGLSSFEYFGLLFDYTFILEGMLTVGLALGFLKCMGYKTVPDDHPTAEVVNEDNNTL